ncbi:mitochondrial carrier [Wolfiporia cocos MD-104 SS10]|uniref:Mitochondrial carrier n=1 Tax=Wolfiporia cocos (strain MD-104) TaxID=742152 RepID=A0A2H3JPH2_WOLCO|nr:mitochondrial carrier [Wolfiporia cocos MD-104 SS10]
MSFPVRQDRPLTAFEGFLCGGLAACTAVTITNPAEVAKTRLQLQGELAKGGSVKVYNNTLDALTKTFRHEGFKGVQRGLGPAYIYQILLNGARLGFYEPIRQGMNRLLGLLPDEQRPITSLLAGASSGVIGASLGNPLFLVKARIQAYSPALPVGTQHCYSSALHAISTIHHVEGFQGLFRGINAAILRTSMGSSVQLPTYNWTKNQLVSRGILPADSIWTFLLSSTVSGSCVLAVMQPADTALTRMYNQPTRRLTNGKYVGVLYQNPIDCLWKTMKAEGPLAWYKGTTAHLIRVVPHTIVTLTANDVAIRLYRQLIQ